MDEVRFSFVILCEDDSNLLFSFDLVRVWRVGLKSLRLVYTSKLYILLGRLTCLLTCTFLWKMSSWFPLLFIRSLTQSPTQLTLNSCHWYFSVTYRRRIPWVEFPSTLPWEGRLGAPPYQVSTSQPKPLTRQNTHDASDAYILPLHVAKAGLSKLNFFCKWTYLLQLWKISEIMVLQSTISSPRWPENCLLDGLIMSRSRQRKGDLCVDDLWSQQTMPT